MKLDPITLSMVQNQLDHISVSMGQAMTRTAHSPIFNQSHDFSCFLTSADGELISQADGIPIHTGGGDLIVKAILEQASGSIEPGDVFLSSDPYVAGGNHLPDWVVSRPVFVAERMVAFVCNRAHQSDIGGGAAGTYNPAATEIFHEGLRLPVMKLQRRHQLSRDLWNLLLLNSRCPELLEGDLLAMLGSTEVGARAISRLVDELGVGTYFAYVAGVLDHAETRMRQAISALPDGVYQATETSDNDCFSETIIKYQVTITVSGDHMVVDFSGTDAQIRGFKNSSFSNTRSSVYVAVASFLDTSIPRNAGTYRPIEVRAPLGSVLHPRPPAPMTMCTVLPAHEIIQACWMALTQADPSRACAGWGKVCHWNMSGENPDGSTYVMYHWGALPAGGAVDGRDGFEQIGPLNSLGNLVVPNCETYEQLYPVNFIRHEQRKNAAGAGKFRGGTGVDYEVEVEANAEYAYRGEGQRTPSGFGADGGDYGRAGAVEVVFANGEQFHPPQFGVGSHGPLRLRISSPAGGGLGDPLERPVEQVLADVLDEVLSPAAAERSYAVALCANGTSVDQTRTAELRQQRKRSRGDGESNS